MSFNIQSERFAHHRLSDWDVVIRVGYCSNHFFGVEILKKCTY